LVSPATGSIILEVGIDAALASETWVAMYVENHPGQDDLFITRNGKHVWPRDEYTSIKSQQLIAVNKTWKFDSSSNFKLIEYDSASGDDEMGGWKFTEKALGEHTLHIYNEDEASTYEVTFVVNEYK